MAGANAEYDWERLYVMLEEMQDINGAQLAYVFGKSSMDVVASFEQELARIKKDAQAELKANPPPKPKPSKPRPRRKA